VLAASFAALAPTFFGDEPVPGYRTLFRLAGGVYATCGLIAWRRRPDSRTGLLMVLTGFGLFVEPLFSQLDPSPLRTVGDLLEDGWSITIIALMLTFLSGGRLRTRADRLLVGVFALQLALEFVRHLFLPREGNFLLVHSAPGVADALIAFTGVLVSFGCLAVAVVIGARWRSASEPRRRAMLPSVAGIAALLFFAVAQQAAPVPLRWLAVLSLLLIPAAFLAGLLRSRLARADLAQLFGDLRSLHGPDLQAALARALGDPALVVGYRAADTDGYIDAGGAPVAFPAGSRVVPVEQDGREIAVLAYDASLEDDPELVDAVSAAAAIALENEHLHAQARTRLAELMASRERIVAAGDAERRRLERNLHDGAQQRLVALAMQLRLLQMQIHSDPAAAEKLVGTASEELALSLGELRELARGIHPAVLDHGLPTALETLTGHCTVYTSLRCEGADGLPEAVELAAYFVTSEALANVAKYAQATTASVRVSRRGPRLVVEIADDGVGGADAARGSGLRGLADRVEALDGRLSVVSPPGQGTLVTAELPHSTFAA
jgi:signal transduction histidine kinase